jgi:ABC-type cobalamin/Fe3+-siderophores transport system ATPase subunit
MLELHNVTIGQHIRALSLTVKDGQLVCLSGQKDLGKTRLLRAILGFVPIEGGHISIDGELLTPKSAPFFRRQMAYVPQRLLVPEGYDKVPTDYVSLLRKAVESGKQLLVVDEPSKELTMEERQVVNNLFREARERGATVLAVNMVTAQNQVTL